VPPDLYLTRKVFDVLQLVSCINRHIYMLVRAVVSFMGDSCIGCRELMATQFEIGSKYPIRDA
jgi:hypothetical protein